MRLILMLSAAALVVGICAAQQRPRFRPIPKNDVGMKTGPAVGENIPAFEVLDQYGQKQTFETLKGDNGLMLLFVRSADW